MLLLPSFVHHGPHKWSANERGYPISEIDVDKLFLRNLALSYCFCWCCCSRSLQKRLLFILPRSHFGRAWGGEENTGPNDWTFPIIALASRIRILPHEPWCGDHHWFIINMERNLLHNSYRIINLLDLVFALARSPVIMKPNVAMLGLWSIGRKKGLKWSLEFQIWNPGTSSNVTHISSGLLFFMCYSCGFYFSNIFIFRIRAIRWAN